MMAVTTYIPLMTPGAWLRNLIITMFLVALPFLIPLLLAYAVAANYNGLADGLSRMGVPGVRGGGFAAGFVVLIVGVVLVIGVSTAIPMMGSAVDSSGSGGGDAPLGDDSADADADADADQQQEANQSSDVQPKQDPDQVGSPNATAVANESDGPQNASGEADNDSGSYDQPTGEPAQNASGGPEADQNNGSQMWGDDYGGHGITVTDFERTLEEGTVDVEQASEDGETTTLIYRTHHQDTDAVVDEILFVAGVYSGYADDTGKEGSLQVDVRDSYGDPLGTWSVSSSDARAFATGEISEDEYDQRVIDSIETVD